MLVLILYVNTSVGTWSKEGRRGIINQRTSYNFNQNKDKIQEEHTGKCKKKKVNTLRRKGKTLVKVKGLEVSNKMKVLYQRIRMQIFYFFKIFFSTYL